MKYENLPQSEEKKETATVYINDSSTHHLENRSKLSCVMDISPGKIIPLDKENVNPRISAENNTNVKESKDFHDKIDGLSLVQSSDESSDNDCNPMHGTKRQTIHFNQYIENSPTNSNTRKSIKMYEDMNVSPASSAIDYKDIQGSRKNVHIPKLVIRKIVTPLTTDVKSRVESENRRFQRYRDKQEPKTLTKFELSPIPKSDKNVTQCVPIVDNSLNFSINSAKHISLSPESSSSLLIPSEYKTYNYKQLNDELEGGKLQLFSKTPTSCRKPKERGYFTNNSKLDKQRKTLFFEAMSITPERSPNKKVKSSKCIDYFDFNASGIQRTKDNKCRFSEADELLLDNTSFLTRARLGDETTSRNSTRRETNCNDLDIFEETLKEAAMQLGSVVIEPKRR